MDFDKMTLFGAVKQRMSWLTQRQEVLSQNIANSDTPKYRAKDIEAFKFEDALRGQRPRMSLARTDSSHMSGNVPSARDFRESQDSRPFETAPGGNAVILEEQMAKVNETQMAHKLTAKLYSKHLSMIQRALGK